MSSSNGQPKPAKRRKATSANMLTSRMSDERAAWLQSVQSRHCEARYRATDRGRFERDMRGANRAGSSADYHYRTETDYFYAMEIARDIDRNDIVVPQAIDRLVSNILQDGFKLDPKTGNERADAVIKERWQMFADDPRECDDQLSRTFDEKAGLTLRHSIVDGDHLLVPLVDGRIQNIETHRLRTPPQLSGDESLMTIHGIRLNDRRQRVAYYVLRDDVAPRRPLARDDFVELPAYDAAGNPNVFHVFHPRRVSQTRGMTKLAPITQACGMHDDVQFAKLVQQQQTSAWSMIRERDLNFYEMNQVDEEFDLRDDPYREGQTQPIKGVGAGTMYTTYPGERISGFSPNVPNPSFFDHAKSIIELIGVNLDLPYTLMMMDASIGSFSAWRGSMEQAKMRFRQFQRWLACSYHSQVFRFKMRQWTTPGTDMSDPLLSRLLASGLNVFAHEWTFPSWPYIQPVEDITADMLETRNAQNSSRRVQARRGRDWDVVSQEIIEDNVMILRRAMMAAEQLQSEFDQSVDWREVLSLPTPDNVSLNLTSDRMDSNASAMPATLGNQPQE